MPVLDYFPQAYTKWKNKEITGKDIQNAYHLSKDAFYRLVHKYEGIEKEERGYT